MQFWQSACYSVMDLVLVIFFFFFHWNCKSVSLGIIYYTYNNYGECSKSKCKRPFNGLYLSLKMEIQFQVMHGIFGNNLALILCSDEDLCPNKANIWPHCPHIWPRFSAINWGLNKRRHTTLGGVYPEWQLCIVI